jgi:putative Mg2+ transporter-C (MgtC) family protein
MEPRLLTPWLELDMVIRLVASALAGGLVGYEREQRDKPAGLRTHMLVSLGACLFTILSVYGFSGSDPSRIAANIVVGVGFLGAGTIIQSRGRVRGLTTAASVWTVAAIGMAIGTGLYLVGIVSAVLVTIILVLFTRLDKEINKTE